MDAGLDHVELQCSRRSGCPTGNCSRPGQDASPLHRGGPAAGDRGRVRPVIVHHRRRSRPYPRYPAGEAGAPSGTWSCWATPPPSGLGAPARRRLARVRPAAEGTPCPTRPARTGTSRLDNHARSGWPAARHERSGGRGAPRRRRAVRGHERPDALGLRPGRRPGVCRDLSFWVGRW
ncbi:hypothetical protein HBB16_18615 [Pseudonocardia sp. MCCB 268]|nr:hypothetical protein [Pseudonocardia cytotoxica]